MCGILGYFSNSKKISSETFARSLNHIHYRGPDNQATKSFDNGHLGHVRLAIIDLEECSNQPFTVNDRYHIVFNGEIYNYNEVKEDLRRKYNVEFKTNSDTEVLLQSYILTGEECVHSFNGMFAFAIYDSFKNTLFVARDRVGKKPFYYTQLNGSFIFSSELKALLPLMDRKPDLSLYAINEFLSIGYIIAPNTIYEGVHKLKAGHWLKIDLNTGALLEKEYWDPVKNKKQYTPEITDTLLRDAVHIRHTSDVPVGIMLSGGLDSNIVMALSKAKDLKTFTIKSDHHDYDESHLAEISAKHFGHENFSRVVTPDVSILDKIIHHYDEPMADSSAIPTFLLSEFIKNHQYKCVLNGDGADEIFAGYDRYKFLLLYKKYRFIRRLIPFMNFRTFRYKGFFYNLKKLKDLLNEKNIIEAYAEQNLINKGFEGERLKHINYKSEIVKRLNSINVEGLNRFIVYDYKYNLADDLLVKMDRATMANSLESRSPFLDYRLAEIFLTSDFNGKISLFRNKKHLRNLYGSILPKEIMSRKKSGFQIPIDHWFLNELKDEILKLKDAEIIHKGFVDAKYVNHIIDNHLSKKQNFKFQIYLLLIFEKWYKKWASD